MLSKKRRNIVQSVFNDYLHSISHDLFRDRLPYDHLECTEFMHERLSFINTVATWTENESQEWITIFVKFDSIALLVGTIHFFKLRGLKYKYTYQIQWVAGAPDSPVKKLFDPKDLKKYSKRKFNPTTLALAQFSLRRTKHEN